MIDVLTVGLPGRADAKLVMVSSLGDMGGLIQAIPIKTQVKNNEMITIQHLGAAIFRERCT